MSQLCLMYRSNANRARDVGLLSSLAMLNSKSSLRIRAGPPG
jgi:hypothetical protein